VFRIIVFDGGGCQEEGGWWHRLSRLVVPHSGKPVDYVTVLNT